MDSENPQIALDEIETEIVTLLDSCCHWINAHRPQPSEEEGGSHVDYNGEVTARIAGGWVRDKLLGMESHDLDVSLSVMTGLNFAILFKTFLLQRDPTASSSSSSSTHSAAASAMSRISKISANPEQSKSLETATANILGLSLDFVNLRKEVYEGNSRIPTMTFGTPQEDAERRDITINTLFFNVRSRQVEDWTGKGLSDMRAGLIRTPLPPLTTFLDDPLRALRCVRFASRFNYELDQDIVGCLTGQGKFSNVSTYDDPRLQDLPAGQSSHEAKRMVKDALMTKVSRERVGIEVDKMMSGPNPLLALRLLNQLELYPLVFHLQAFTSTPLVRSATTQQGLPAPDVQSAASLSIAASEILDGLLEYPTNPPSSLEQADLPKEIVSCLSIQENRRLLNFACALLPLSDIEVEEKKGKWLWSGEKVLMAGLKLGRNNTMLPMLSLIRSIPYLSDPASIDSSRLQLIANIPEGVDLPREALVAMLLRDKNLHNASIGIDWTISLTLAFIKDILDVRDNPVKKHEVVQSYRRFCEYVEGTGVAERLDEKPLLDGNELLATLSLSPSPLLPKIQNALLIWQFSRAAPIDHVENESLKEQARRWLQEKWDAGDIVPLDHRSDSSAKTGIQKKAKAKKGTEEPLEKRRKS